MKVIWIDPGETVGWATFRVDTKAPSIELLDYGNTKLRPFAMKLLEVAHEYDWICFETYAIRADKLKQHAGSTVPTLQLVGMIRLAQWEGQRRNGTGFPQLDEQDPGFKKRGYGAMKLWLPGEIELVDEALAGRHDDGHFGDAVMHAAAWFHERWGKDVKHVRAK